MFRHLSNDDLKVLQDRANTSAGSNLEVMLGLALAFLRIELNNEVADRASVESLPANRFQGGAPQGPVAGDAGQTQGGQSSGGAAS